MKNHGRYDGCSVDTMVEIIVVYPTYPIINKTKFNDGDDWKELHGYVTEAITPYALDPRGK